MIERIRSGFARLAASLGSLLAICVAVSTVASAGPIGGQFQDDPLKFQFQALHGAVGGAPLVHDLAVLFAGDAGDEWVFSGTLKETAAGGGVGAKLKLDAKVTHNKTPPGAPHGEGANPKPLAFSADLEAGKGQLANAGLNLVSLNDDQKHVNHFDVLAGAGLLVLVNANKLDLDAFVFLGGGGHTDKDPRKAFKHPGNEGPKSGNARLESSTDTGVFGAAGWLLDDPSIGDFALSLAVFGVSPADVTAAHILLGQMGPVILDLLPTGFFDLAGLGAGFALSGVDFPAAHVDSLLAGQTFLKVQTAEGDITGVLSPIFIPHPRPLTLLSITAFGVFGYGWVRRKRTSLS